MTAHKQKPTLTPERIEWFARYHHVHLAWGVFHVYLDDGNYDIGFTLYDQSVPDDVREAGDATDVHVQSGCVWSEPVRSS